MTAVTIEAMAMATINSISVNPFSVFFMAVIYSVFDGKNEFNYLNEMFPLTLTTTLNSLGIEFINFAVPFPSPPEPVGRRFG